MLGRNPACQVDPEMGEPIGKISKKSRSTHFRSGQNRFLSRIAILLDLPGAEIAADELCQARRIGIYSVLAQPKLFQQPIGRGFVGAEE